MESWGAEGMAGGACGGLNIEHPTSNIQRRRKNLSPQAVRPMHSTSARKAISNEE